MNMLILSVIPAAVLLIYVFRQDKIEKEPLSLLARLFALGALTIVSAIVIGSLADRLVTLFIRPYSLAYLLIDNFLIVALVEEGGKYFVLKKRTWNSPHFNYLFDAEVYAVTVSLGFATPENILYLTGATISDAVLRGLLAVPGHAINGVFMGYYYGLAKWYDRRGYGTASRRNLKLALWIPVVCHGFYDFCLSTDSGLFMLLFLLFEIVVMITAFRTVRRLSRSDTPL